MAKNIILLSDGTGNSAGKLQKTNVWRLYQALDLTRPDQIAYYDDGVGTSSFKPLAILGGALGLGLKRNVLDLYEFLCRHYEDGDRIYCFGFSRGAFTIRVLSGFIKHQGLIPPAGTREMRREARAAYRRYRDARYHTALGLEKPLRALRNLVLGAMDQREPPQRRQVTIAFMGLWDTVSAYGLPFDELTKAWNWVFPISVPDRNPSDIVQRACHALALDDERHTFHPVLWNEAKLPGGNSASRNIAEERITQVWFTGMHSNVGGGYPDDALSHVSLDWMLRQAAAHDLYFRTHEVIEIGEDKNALGKLHDSRHGLGGFYRYAPQRIALLAHDVADANNQVIIARPKIHESVLRRIENGVNNYAPIGVPRHFAVVDENGDILEGPQLAQRFPVFKPMLESTTWSEDIARVWDQVWWRRVVYSASVSMALLLAVFPVIRPATLACEGPFCFLSSVVRGIGALLPAFLAPWFTAFEVHPGSFSLIVLCLAGLLSVGGRLQLGIFDRMRAVWMGRALPQPGAMRRLLHCVARIGQRVSASGAARLLRVKLIPFVAGLAVVYLALAAINNAIFSMMSSQGAICRSTPSIEKLVDVPIKRAWPANASCFASGIELEAGRRYIITLTTDDRWRDGGLGPVPVAGMDPDATKWSMRMGIPLRRHWSKPYFKPYARIGRTGSDEYPLSPADWSTRSTNRMQAEFTARSSNELFLYLNDAVLPVPDSWQWFYNNNSGIASVTMEAWRYSTTP